METESEALRSLQEAEQETPDNQEMTPEDNPEDEAEETVETIEDKQEQLMSVDKQIENDSALVGKLEQQLQDYEAERAKLGFSSEGESPQVAQDLEKVKKRRLKLEEQKEEWVEENGRENVPESIVIDAGDNAREAKGVQGKKEGGAEDKEKRKQSVEQFKAKAIDAFKKVLKSDWKVSDAVNLDLAIDVMKTKMSALFGKKEKEYLDGKGEDILEQTVWLKWHRTPLIEQAIGKPNMIKKLEVYFGDTPVPIATEDELGRPEEEAQKKEAPRGARPV